MTVGEGIFWGAIIIAIVGLYATTKDRWKWKRIAKWGIGLPVLLLALGGAGTWVVKTYGDRAQPQSSFGGLALSSSEGDVRFARGEPSLVVEDGRWVFYAGSGSAKPESAGYVVGFRDGKVRYVRYVSTPDQIVTPDLQGFTIGSSYARVLDELGPASDVATSNDGLLRRLSYAKLNTFYTFEKAQIKDFGIYEPASGPLEFSAPAKSPQPAASAPQTQYQAAPEVKPILDHCAPGLAKAERMKRLAQHGTVRETGTGAFDVSGRMLRFGYDGALLYCE